MAVEVTTEQLFEQIGRLFVEARVLTDQNSHLEQAVQLLRDELLKANASQAEKTPITKGPAPSPTT